jgi:hypothetical protein
MPLLFDANFLTGIAGSENTTKEFHASGTSVLGSASSVVPMTLLKLFGNNSDTISVICRADTGRQNSDIMMVLDVTKSMDSCANEGGSCTETKIQGLRKAAACFYEQLTRIDSTLCPNTPTSATSTSRTRIGFMPYNINVNVGKLLSNGYFADTWTYQSRVWGTPIVAEVQQTEVTTVVEPGTPTTWTASGSPSTPASLANTTAVTLRTSTSGAVGAANGTTVNSGTGSSTTVVNFTPPTASSFALAPVSSWGQSGSNVTIAGTNYQKEQKYNKPTGTAWTSLAGTTDNEKAASFCLSKLPVTQIGSVSTSGSASNLSVVAGGTPVYPATTTTSTYSTTQNYAMTSYKYRFKQWEGSSEIECELMTGTATLPITATWATTLSGTWSGATTGSTTTAPITTATTSGTGWTYKPVPTTISGFKSGTVGWNSSISLPIGTSGAAKTVPWDGCIQEAHTFKNTDGTVSDDWLAIPAEASDMNINLVPSSTYPETLWAPALKDAVWARYNFVNTTTNNTTTGISSRSLRNSGNLLGELQTMADLPSSIDYACPAQANKLQEWPVAAAFDGYLNGLTPNGNTYHDIGLVWGARFLSDDGIFAGENQTASNGKPIERHMVFMTDGDTSTNIFNYGSQGLNWWDRKQTTAEPTNAILNDLVNARTTALCTRIKNQNITLWVIAYGSGINSASKDRLKLCATSAAHYFVADTTTSLNTAFGSIAGQIGGLRLTN